ncbi:TIGR03749 family integrating conjugative element protein [Pseudomonas monteilii]|nr:TIGR03749 family integrating conjugative element protein [Pseudomonas monteilii]
MTVRNWVLAIGLAAMADAHAVEIMQWERIPLAIPLLVGKERIVFVDQNVRVGMPQDLVGSLRVQSTGGTVYLMANREIPPTRLQLQNMATGEIMLVDITATPEREGQAALEPVKIVPGVTSATRYGQSATGVAKSTTVYTTPGYRLGQPAHLGPRRNRKDTPGIPHTDNGWPRAAYTSSSRRSGSRWFPARRSVVQCQSILAALQRLGYEVRPSRGDVQKTDR